MSIENVQTRRYSSRIGTIRCSGHLGGGGWCLPSGGVCPGWCLPRGGVHPPTQRQTPPDPEADTPPDPEADSPPDSEADTLLVDRIFDTHLWKHYLSATTVADGNEEKVTNWCVPQPRPSTLSSSQLKNVCCKLQRVSLAESLVDLSNKAWDWKNNRKFMKVLVAWGVMSQTSFNEPGFVNISNYQIGVLPAN